MISIVDDDDGFRASLGSLLRSLGYTSKMFGSAEEFLESSHVDRTVCLISDVQMPGMNGIELQSRIRALGCSAAVIFVTGYPDERNRARAFDGGALGFLEKPFEERAIIGLIEKALQTRHSG